MTETIEINKKDLIVKPLWYHKQNLMQTASGYGRKLRTEYMIKVDNKLHRIYCCIYSNNGTNYIIKNGKWIFIDIY